MKLKQNTLPLLLISSFLAAACDAQVVETYRATLYKPEFNQLSEIACQRPFNEKVDHINALKYEKLATHASDAEVHCISNITFHGSPIYKVTNCTRTKTTWDCDPPIMEFSLKIGDTPLTIQTTLENWNVAYDTVKAIAPTQFQGRSLLHLFKSNVCKIGKDLTPIVVTTETKDLVEVNCGFAFITVSTFCPTAQCPRVIAIDYTIP